MVLYIWFGFFLMSKNFENARSLYDYMSALCHVFQDGKSPTHANPKGLDILVAAGSGHSRSDGYPPPDLVPSSAGSCSMTTDSIDRMGENLGTPTHPNALDVEGLSVHTSPATLRPTSAEDQRDLTFAEPGMAVDSAGLGPSKPNE